MNGSSQLGAEQPQDWLDKDGHISKVGKAKEKLNWFMDKYECLWEEDSQYPAAMNKTPQS